MPHVTLAVLAALLAAAAFLAPVYAAHGGASLVSLLLVVAGMLEVWQSFRRSTPARQRAGWVSGGITVAMGVLVANAATLAATGIVVLLAGWFAVDTVRYVWRGIQGAGVGAGGAMRDWVLPALGNAAVVIFLLLLRRFTLEWTLALAAGARIAGTAWNLATASVFLSADAGATATDDIGLSDRPEFRPIVERLAQEEAAREPIDRGWTWALIATLFAIHLGRMGFDRSRLGIASPVVAVVGDVFLALVLAYVVVVPLRLAFRGLTRRIERQAWRWCLSEDRGQRWPAPVRWILERRLRISLRLRRARYSARTALSRGLQIGLPIAAIIASIVPVFGMSWFFDSENWATGLWNSWAEARTDPWRESMVNATFTAEQARDPSQRFAVTPDGISGGDFSFLVIGDPGEGDASQHVLRDQVLTAAAKPEVKFVAISSDVVYPTGTMKDYEAKFWLPMKGVTKPVYAIPGNHDWYDALEAFAATFFEPDAARIAMHARVEADEGISTTTTARIDELIAKAAFYRAQYGVPTGFQRAPFFDVQTDDFALIAVDTGVIRDVDPVQWRWLEATLEQTKGKFVMAVLGHPPYAGGRYVAAGDEPFMRLDGLLKRYGVPIVMAGDTHDFEYYLEPRSGSDGAAVTHYFVNGGGGAYLSFGTSMDWPATSATERWGIYPRTEQVRSKIQSNMTVLKLPLWWWTDKLGAWPFSVEWLSSAFDSNVAPFFQSFVEVRVERSLRQVRTWPYGVNGRLRWSDIQGSSDLVPAGMSRDDFAEWVIPFR
jgi:hypothetical protein